jgi:hypothetical protein
MGIIKPVPLSDSNLAGATEVNSALDTIDAHNHTSGRGLQVPSLGININAALPMNGFGLTSLGPAILASQGSGGFTGLSSATKIGLYAGGSGGDLWYNDGSGVAIQITTGHNVNVSAAGAIQGLGAPAAAKYAAGIFTWQSNTAGPVPASMDHGDLILRRAGASNPNAITITTVNSLAANYTITLPGVVGSAALQVLATLDNAGNTTWSTLVDNATLENTTSVIRVKDGGITYPKLATPTTVSADFSSGSLSANTSGDVPGGTLGTNAFTVSSANRPVFVSLQGQPGATGKVTMGFTGAGFGELTTNLQVDGVTKCSEIVGFGPPSGSGTTDLTIPIRGVLLTSLGAGAHTIKLTYNWTATGSVTSCSYTSLRLIAQEL